MENKKPEKINKELTPIIDLFKNVKFIVINAIVLVILAFAVFSGKGEKLILNMYESITGEKYETFSPIENSSDETYVILKYKLEDQNVDIQNAEIKVFKESDKLIKYKVIVNNNVSVYKIEKGSNGIWKITQGK
jgi:uncharacterized membrane protein